MSEEIAWHAKFHELESFKNEHGHVQIPDKYPPNQKLSNWLKRQRFVKLSETSSKKLKCDATREQRRQKLRSLGVIFPFEQPSSAQDEIAWQTMFIQLQQYKENHGHVQVPQIYPTNQPLSTWLKGQRHNTLNERSSQKLKCADTREQRRQKLRSLGVTFPFEQPPPQSIGGRPSAGTEDQSWQEKFRQLEDFKKEHGHVRIPKKYPQNQPLSKWLKRQRYDKLNDNSSQKLNSAAKREQRRQQLQLLGVTFPSAKQQPAQGRQRSSGSEDSSDATTKKAKKTRLA